MKGPALAFALLICTALAAQENLVPNPSFEEYYYIPCSTGPTINDCKYWVSATGGGASPDYFSVFSNPDPSICYTNIPQNAFGYQNAKDGNFYAGIWAYNLSNSNVCEYIETKLTSSLLAKKYCVKFYVSLADSVCHYAINNIGIYFSHDSIFTSQAGRLTQYSPQVINVNNPLTDKIGWTLVSGEFIATGGERYMTIGNFNSPENDDTTLVGDFAEDWGISYLYIDSVSVTLCDGVGIEENEAKQINTYPNPANGLLTVNTGTLKDVVVELYDMAGRKVFTQKVFGPTAIIDVSGLSNGVYICTVSNNQPVKREKVVIHK